MNTTNDGGIHPMVMKAARVLNKMRADLYGISEANSWGIFGADFIARAHSVLTECGALECLEALEASERVQTNADADAAHMLAYNAITKVYGSAPE